MGVILFLGLRPGDVMGACAHVMRGASYRRAARGAARVGGACLGGSRGRDGSYFGCGDVRAVRVRWALGDYCHAVHFDCGWCCRALCCLAYGTILTVEMSRGAWWACVVACCLARRLFWCAMGVFGEGRPSLPGRVLELLS